MITETVPVAKVQARFGQYTQLGLKGAEGGIVPRWGTPLRIVGDRLLVEGYHDSAGIGYEYGRTVIDGHIAVLLSEIVKLTTPRYGPT